MSNIKECVLHTLGPWYWAVVTVGVAVVIPQPTGVTVSYLFEVFIWYFYLLHIMDIYNDSLTSVFVCWFVLFCFFPISTLYSCMTGYSFCFYSRCLLFDTYNFQIIMSLFSQILLLKLLVFSPELYTHALQVIMSLLVYEHVSPHEHGSLFFRYLPTIS